MQFFALQSFEKMPPYIRTMAADLFHDLEQLPDKTLEDKFAQLMVQIALAWFPPVH